MSQGRIPKKIKTWSLTILLIRQDLKTDGEILGDLRDLKRVNITLQDGDSSRLVDARLYYRSRYSKPPPWADFFGDLIDAESLPASVSVPAVLLVPVDQRMFAVPFAYGSSLVETGAIDPAFGLRAALNSINPEKVRSYDKRSFDALFRQTREQAAKETKLESFGIDAERDLVRSVAGKPQDKSLGSSMTGGKSLRVSVRMIPNRLAHYLRRVYRVSKQQKFSEVYPWLGRIKEELDDEIKRTLDSYLDDKLRSSTEGLWLAVPEIIDWSEISGFRYVLPNRNKHIFHDIDFGGLKKAVDDDETIDVALLKSKNVEMLNDEDTKIKSWKLYDCLNAEIEIGEEAYVLSAGSWYKIDPELLEEINLATSALLPPDFSLPLYSTQDDDEYSYNLRAAGESAGKFCCLDQKLIAYGGGRNKFELCDLLRENGDLVHVKRYGGSAVLSHLFAQGFVSAELLRRREGFRKNADKLVAETGFQLTPPTSFNSKRSRSVVYVIIGGPANTRKKELPLFSRVNLRNVVRNIQAFDWNVNLLYVAETEEQQKLTRQKKTRRNK